MFFSVRFQEFSLSLWFSISLAVICLIIVFFVLVLLGTTRFLKSVKSCLSPNLERSGALFLQSPLTPQFSTLLMGFCWYCLLRSWGRCYTENLGFSFSGFFLSIISFLTLWQLWLPWALPLVSQSGKIVGFLLELKPRCLALWLPPAPMPKLKKRRLVSALPFLQVWSASLGHNLFLSSLQSPQWVVFL